MRQSWLHWRANLLKRRFRPRTFTRRQFSTAPSLTSHRVPVAANANDFEQHAVIPKARRLRDKRHREFVAAQPCLICGRQPSDAHHLRFAQPKALGRKVSDEFTVPVCRTHHREIHQTTKEREWWLQLGIDPMPVADKLWAQTHPLTLSSESAAF